MNDRPAANGGGRMAIFLRLSRLTLTAVLNSLPLGLLSLLLALVIWATVTTGENPSVRRTLLQEIPVDQVNIPRTLLPTNVSPAKVAVTVSGPRNAVDDVRPEDVVAQVDLSRVDEEIGGARETTVERAVRAEVRRRGVRAEVSPESVKVTLELQERRTVPVCVDKVDVPPPGFSVEEPVTTDPAEASISGPLRNIDAVECAAAVVRLTGLTVSVQSQVPLEPRDAAGRPIGGVAVQPATAAVSVKIRQDLFPRQVAIDVRVQGRPAPGYTISGIRADPPLATVVGPLEVVRALNAVSTEVIDIEGARSDIVRAVALEIPPGVSSGERRTVVTISLQATRTPGSIGVTPSVVNLAPGLTATLNTPVVAVQVSGPLADVLALKPADIAVTVDAAGLSPGVHQLQPQATVPPTVTFDAVTPDRVEIVIGQQR
ncbi:MAG: CdaR family protein [Dehalococcoidia bacterium]